MDIGQCRKLLFIVYALMLAALLFYAYFTCAPALNLFVPEPTQIPLPNFSDINDSYVSNLTIIDYSNTSPSGADVSEKKHSAGFQLFGALGNAAQEKYIKSHIGHIWPRRNGIETNGRTVNQIHFIDEFWPKEAGATSKPLPLKLEQMKVILKVGDFNFRYLKEGQSHFVDDNCPVNSCTVTGNQSARHTADALIISEFDWDSREKFLPKPSHQIWIAQHFESAKHNRIDASALNSLINWTATYRRDSTIRAGYGNFVSVVNATPITDVNYASGKTKGVAWLVKNCKPSNHRKSYVNELRRYIDVDIYGACGTMKCPTNGSCTEWIGLHYKFYLAFENSNCKDYITEKFFHNALNNNILPIVLGARLEDYLAVSPPMSYIHVDDYRTALSLAAYLHHLDNDDAAYNEYFAWKGTMVNVRQRYWCRICTLLHLQQRDGYVHWYDDYAAWWNDACTAGSDRVLSSKFLSSAAYSGFFLLQLFYCYGTAFRNR